MFNLNRYLPCLVGNTLDRQIRCGSSPFPWIPAANMGSAWPCCRVAGHEPFSPAVHVLRSGSVYRVAQKTYEVIAQHVAVKMLHVPYFHIEQITLPDVS